MNKFIPQYCSFIICLFLITSCNSGSSSSIVSSSQTFSSISTGGNSSCGISQNDGAYCWGRNIYGQLGNGSYISESTPTHVIESISGKFNSITVAESNACALNINGKAYCWGYNNFGQLGIASSESSTSNPTPVAGDLNYVQLSAGNYHSCGLTSNGKLYCWGNNQFGQLGNGSTNNESSPTLVSGDLSFKTVDAGGYTTCGITTNNKTYCWGDGQYGKLGNGTNSNSLVPVAVIESVSGNFTQISVRRYATCGLNANGVAYCWGGNLYGQLGDGTYVNESYPTAIIESASGNFKQISSGRYHTCGINFNNQTFCWGGNLYGQLGDGLNDDSFVPVAVIESVSSTFKQISAGKNSTCGININNKGFCWGGDLYGQLGDGSYSDKSVPVAINASKVN